MREAYLSKKRSEAQNTAQDNAKDVSWKLNLLSETHENMLAMRKIIQLWRTQSRMVKI